MLMLKQYIQIVEIVCWNIASLKIQKTILILGIINFVVLINFKRKKINLLSSSIAKV